MSWSRPLPVDDRELAHRGVGRPPVHPRLNHTRLYLCTPDRPDILSFVSDCIKGGVDVIQLRDKHLDARTLTKRAALLCDLCRDHGVPFIVNDRPDIALAVGADGVHVGQDDVSTDLCRSILGNDAIVGLSTHSPPQLEAANAQHVDYVSVGPVSATPTKPGRPGTGLEYVAWAAAHSSKPFFITGGVDPSKIASLVDEGAKRFVVVRYLTEAPDPMAAARVLRREIDDQLGDK